MSFLKNLQNQLERIAGTHNVAVKVNVDDAGYLDRACAHPPCGRGFKVKHDDVSKFGDEGWCVYCGHKDSIADFATVPQTEHFGAVAADQAKKLFNDAMRRAAKSTPRTSKTYDGKHASVTITESVDVPDVLEVPNREPPEAWDVMRVEAACDRCRCRFAGIGGCFFCPACGYRSADLTFDETLRRMRDALSKERELEAAIGLDGAADIMAKMSEADVQALVTAFEAFAKDSFPRLAPAAPDPARGVFQRLTSGSDLWSGNGGQAFHAILTPVELAELSRFFQQRHVLAHNNGFVDAAYCTNSGDTTYEVGQRLAIKPDQVRRMADLVAKLVNGLRADLP